MSGFVKAGQTFLKTLMSGGKQKTTGTEVISSVPVSKNVKKYGADYSKARTRLDASYQRGQRVDKNYKTMKEAKESFKGAKKDLQKMVDTGQATKINKKVHRKGIEYKSDDLYPNLKKKTENKAKGGRVGLKAGTNPFKRKTNIDKIKKTFGTKNKLGIQSIIYGLDKNPKITAADPKAKFIAAAKNKKKKVI